MKITTNKFEDYLSDCKKVNIHKELTSINNLIYSINGKNKQRKVIKCTNQKKHKYIQ